jgi:hypothetical protein
MDAFRDQNPNPVLPFAIRHPIEAVSRLTRADACVQEVFRSVAPDRVDAIDDDDSKDEFDALEVFGTAQLRPNLSSAIAQLRPLLPSAPHLSAKRPNPKEGDPRGRRHVAPPHAYGSEQSPFDSSRHLKAYLRTRALESHVLGH